MKSKQDDGVVALGHTVDMFGHVNEAEKVIAEQSKAAAVERSASKKKKLEEKGRGDMVVSRTKSMVRPASKKMVTAKAEKAGKQVVRETFSMPGADSKLIEELRLRAARSGVMLNRSEIVRAGLEALSLMDEKSLLALGVALPRMKTGRPT